MNRIPTSLQHLERYHVEEYCFHSRIVVLDETWCHNFEPETRRQSKQWKHMDSPNKSEVEYASSLKVIMAFLFDCKGLLLIDFLEHGARMDAHVHGNFAKIEARHQIQTPRNFDGWLHAVGR